MADTALAFRREASFQMVVQAVGNNVNEDLPGDIQQGDASILVSELAITFLLIGVDDCGVLEILRDLFMMTHHLEERRQMIHELRATVLIHFNKDRVRSGRFSAGELLLGPGGFVERGREVEIGIGLHLIQTSDGGVGDGAGTGEDAPEVVGQLLWNLCLLRE
ncbi:hypothetical protein SprV_0200706400 [Sparganum proliferum]